MRSTIRALLLGCIVIPFGSPTRAAEPGALSLDLGGGVKVELAPIPAGTFQMGSPEREKEGQACERPVHAVRIAKPFLMGKHEVTNAQYRRFRPAHSSRYLDGDDQPALWVSWYDADAFCRWLSKKAGRTVRLPAEAEWEYACRAGTNTRFYTGDQARLKDSVDLGNAGWFGSNSRGLSQPVGQKAPNAFGLYDMHGNAWEWCSDWYGKDYYKDSPEADPQGPATGRTKVLRGGSYRFWTTYYCRSAHRYSCRPDARECVTGFRVVVEAGRGRPRPPTEATQPWPAPHGPPQLDRSDAGPRDVAVAWRLVVSQRDASPQVAAAVAAGSRPRGVLPEAARVGPPRTAP